MSTREPGSRSVSLASSTLDLAQHLAHDDLDVLVGDFHALTAVDGLNFLHQVVLHGLHAQNAQQIVGVDGAFDQLVAGLHVLAVLHLQAWRRS